MNHVVEGEPEAHASTYGVIFRASPTGGSIRDWELDGDSGSDDWRAGWFDGLPDGVEVPDGAPGDDLEPFLE